MKIGMVLDHTFPPDIRVENEALSLIKAGHQVTILCYAKKSEKNPLESYKGITLSPIKTIMPIAKKLRALTNTILNFYPYYWAYYIKRLIQKHNIEVLHVHDLYMLSSAFIANKKLKLPVIADLHENYAEGLKNYKFANTFLGKLFISIEKWERTEIEWCKKADHIITVIDEAVDRYEQLGIPRDKISVVANYVDYNEFLNEPQDNTIAEKFKDKFVISYIGGFDYHRGIESVVKAVPEIVKYVKNLCVVLVGKGKNQLELIALAKSLNVDSYISFEGFQAPQKVPYYIKASNLCLIPHLKSIHTDNTIPHKLFHYMLLKKPVIASNCEPLKRIIEDTQCGLVYESGNHNHLANSINSIYKDKERISKMGTAGYDAVKEKYNWFATANNLTALYNTIKK